MTSIESQAELILNQIVTRQEKDEAQRAVASTSYSQWSAARLAQRLIVETEGELSTTAVYMSVASLYHIKETTARRMCYVAQTIPEGLADAHPLLTFNHWKVAADAKHLKRRARIESILDIVFQIEAYHEAYGKLPTINTVNSWVYRGDNHKTNTVWRSRTEGVTSQLDKIFNDPKTPKELRPLIGWVRAMLSSYLETGVSPMTGDPVILKGEDQSERR